MFNFPIKSALYVFLSLYCKNQFVGFKSGSLLTLNDVPRLEWEPNCYGVLQEYTSALLLSYCRILYYTMAVLKEHFKQTEEITTTFIKKDAKIAESKWWFEKHLGETDSWSYIIVSWINQKIIQWPSRSLKYIQRILRKLNLTVFLTDSSSKNGKQFPYYWLFG